MRAAGATYEELHAAGGGIVSISPRRAPPARKASPRRRRVTESGCGARARRRGRRSRATGSTGPPSSPSCGSCGLRAASRRSSPARGPAEYDDTDAYVEFVLDEVLPEAAKLAHAADVFVERGAFDAAQARRYLLACREAGLALRLHGDQFTEAGAIPLAVELGARSVDHLEATGPEGIRTLAASEVVGVLLPASALFLGRPMPPARELVDAGAAGRSRDRLQPRERLLRKPSARVLARPHTAPPAPAEALSACTVNAAHVLDRADRKGRIAPGYDADLVLLDAADWRYLAYHLGGDIVHTVVEGGAVSWSSGRVA